MQNRIRLILAGGLVVAVAAALTYLALRGGDPMVDIERRVEASRLALREGRFDDARVLLAQLLAENPRNLRVRRNYAVALLKTNRVEEAGRIAQKSLEMEPDHASSHAILSRVALAENDPARAIAEARLALAGRDVPPNALADLAFLLIDQGLLTEGVSLLARAVEQGKGGPAAELLLAAAVVELKATAKGSPSERARRALTEMFDRAAGELEAAPDDVAAAVRYGRLALVLGRYDAARRVLTQVREERGLAASEAAMLARSLHALGRTDEAAGLLAAVETTEPEETREVAAAWIELGEAEKALDAVDAALVAAPNAVPLLRLRMRALGGSKAPPAEIEAAATTLLGSRPFDETGRRLRALARLSQGRVDGALEDVMALRRTAPPSPQVHWIHGLVLLEAGHPESALMLLLRGRAAEPQDGDRWIARAAIRAGDVKVAQSAASRLTEDEDTALEVAADVLRGELDRAEAAARSPAFAAGRLLDRVEAARLLYEAGRPEAAENLLASAGSEADSPAGKLALSTLLMAMGRDRESEEILREAMEGKGLAARIALLSLTESLLARDDPEGETLLARLREEEDGKVLARILEGNVALAAGDADGALSAASDVLAERADNPAGRVLRLAALTAARAKREELEEAAEAVLRVAPGYRPARLIRARRLLDQARKSLAGGDFEGAETALSDAILLGGSGGPLFFRGWIRSQTGRFDAAEEDVGALLSEPGSEGAGKLLLGLLRLRQGRHGEAIAAFRESAETEPGALAALGMVLLETGRPEEALETADRLLATPGAGFEALVIKCKALVALGRSQEALLLANLRVVSHGEARARLLAGQILLAAGRQKEAAVRLAEVVAAEPDLPAARALLVGALHESGDREGALRVAEETIGRPGLAAVGHILRSRIRRMAGDFEGEIEDLRAATGQSPRNAAIRQILAVALARAGRRDDARTELETAIELAPHEPGPRLELAYLDELEGRSRQAVAAYEKVLEIQPGNAVALNNLAHHLSREPGGAGRAVELAREAVRREPNNGGYRDTLATALAADGKLDEAAAAAREAMRLAPGSSPVALNAAGILKAAGLPEEARAAAEAAVEAAGPKEREEVLRRVGALGLDSRRR